MATTSTSSGWTCPTPTGPGPTTPTEGAIVVVTAKGKVVGAHILAPAAGEMIHELALAINEGLKLAEVASLIHVYPTISTGIGQLAGEAAFEGAKRFRWLVRKEK